MSQVDLIVNGRNVSLEVTDDETLLDALRDHLGLLAAKDGCQGESLLTRWSKSHGN